MAKKNLLLILLVFLGGAVFGWIGQQVYSSVSTSDSGSSEQRLSGYKYTNPLLECENNEGEGLKELADFKIEINETIDQESKLGNVSEASVYFRDLNNGPWLGYNEDELFVPASLLKVPLMMSYYKIAEKDPTVLETRIPSEKLESKFTNDLLPQSKITPGTTYTVQELIDAMIRNSDNNAMASLLQNTFMNEQQFYKIFKDLNIFDDLRRGQDDEISVKVYASFFRILYNASYLNKDFSERSLKLLTQTTFKGGIRKSLPDSVEVAHKFGLRVLKDQNEIQLHDCGIVYYPKNPYLLCVMTRGQSFEKLNEVIARISHQIYTEISTQREIPTRSQ